MYLLGNPHPDYEAKYPGAIDRFKSVLKEDPEFTNRDSVYFYLADALVKTGYMMPLIFGTQLIVGADGRDAEEQHPACQWIDDRQQQRRCQRKRTRLRLDYQARHNRQFRNSIRLAYGSGRNETPSSRYIVDGSSVAAIQIYRVAWLAFDRNSGDSIQQLTSSMRQMQTLAPWQGSPEWSFRFFLTTPCSEACAG